MKTELSRDASSRPSVGFAETVEAVKEQIEIDCIDHCREQAEEMAWIVAEIYRLPPETQVRIAGVGIRAEDVQEVYRRLTCEHIRYAIERFNALETEIKSKKSYIRTVLYNAAFEYRSAIENGASVAAHRWA